MHSVLMADYVNPIKISIYLFVLIVFFLKMDSLPLGDETATDHELTSFTLRLQPPVRGLAHRLAMRQEKDLELRASGCGPG